MPAPNSIAPDKLARLIGTHRQPALIDVRDDLVFAANPRLVPGARRRAAAAVADWADTLAGEAVIVLCQDGGATSHGVAAWLRQAGLAAEALEGGVAAWAAADLPMIVDAKLPARDARGRTVWVTRARPKVDRIACPWLIRRFVDPSAAILYVPPAEIQGVAEQFAAAPFDVEGVFWSHRGERCTFDVMVEELGLASVAPLVRLAAIVRGADTGRLDLTPESPGLLAASLGLSRMYPDDQEQLEAGLMFYDAFYRWCRDAADETHDWTSHRPAKAGRRS